MKCSFKSMALEGHKDSGEQPNQDWRNIQKIMPFMWEYRGRVLLALLTLIISKVAMVGVPLLLKEIVDGLDQPEDALLVLPVVLLLAYGVLRLISSIFNELRDVIFARVRYRAMRRLSHQVLSHLYQLSLRFHLERKTGNISQDLNRGAQSVSSILNYMVFSLVPTIAEFVLVAFILLGNYPPIFAVVTFMTVTIYIVFTLLVTNWRMYHRTTMNALESKGNGLAIDGLLNYETVKYFTNEDYETERFDQTLNLWEDAAVRAQSTMSLLNFGQGVIISVGVTAIMWFAAQGVVDGHLSLGDLVLVNTMMLQLFLPLGLLGIIYRALKYAMVDMDQVFRLLEKAPEISDKDDARTLQVPQGQLQFSQIEFSYNDNRPILKGISFEVPSGHKVAIVGASGSGKSTLARLLFRFYEQQSGSISIDDQDIRDVTQKSLRQQLGIVPQDTVLFNDTIAHNIGYARPNATEAEVIEAAKVADIHRFISQLPEGYDTVVGERGLKLSGGEKQRIAIARVVLKQPPIMIFDEATSSLDSQSEQNILSAMQRVSQGTTTLVIAHRLSTVVDADTIIVMHQGEIVERGNHQTLIAKQGAYFKLWQLQQSDES